MSNHALRTGTMTSTPSSRARLVLMAAIALLVLAISAVIVPPVTADALGTADRDTFTSNTLQFGYGVQIFEPTQPHHRSTVLLFSDEKSAEQAANAMNDAFDRGEKKADKWADMDEGEREKHGDKFNTDKPAGDSKFTTQKNISNKWVVVSDGREIGEYETEDEANIVANELNDEAEKQSEKDGCIDPDIFGEDREKLGY